MKAEFIVQRPRSRPALSPIPTSVPNSGIPRLGLSQKTIACFQSGIIREGHLEGKFLIPLHNQNGELVGYCYYDLASPNSGPIVPHGTAAECVLFNIHRAKKQTHLLAHPLKVLQAHERGLQHTISLVHPATQVAVN